MRRTAIQIALTAVAVIGASMAWAHHSHGNFMTTEYTHLEGTIVEFHWMNPHTWIYLDVPDETGQSTIWVLEGASPVELSRSGWSQDSIAVGDTISVRCHRLRDGSNGCLLGFLTPEGGTEKEWD